MKRLPSFDEIRERFPALAGLGGPMRFRSVPYVQQLTATECGAACLAMVLRYHGKVVTVDGLRDLVVSGRDATNAQALIDAARLHGLRGRAVTLEIDQLEYLDRGTILHWEFNHFVVLDKVRRRSVRVVDPKKGRWDVPMEQFRQLFTGVAILFEPDDHFRKDGRTSSGAIKYLRQILTEKEFFAHIVGASVLMQVFGLATPLISRSIIDHVVPQGDYQLLTILAAGAVLLALFQAWTTSLRGIFFLYLRTRLDSRMTMAFLSHLLTLPYDFFQRRTSGDLMIRMASNSTVRGILTGATISTVLDGTLAIGYLGLLLVISPTMAALTLVLALIQGTVFIVTRRKQRILLAQGLDAQAKSQGYLMEMLGAVETLKAMGAEDRAVDRWSTLFAAELNVATTRGRLDTTISAISTFVRGCSAMALLSVAALHVLDGRLTLGEMFAMTAIANGFLGPLSSLLSVVAQLQLLSIYLERLSDVFETKSERDDNVVAPSVITGTVDVQNVSFRYGPISPLVLERVSLSIAPGEFVALVGPSGAGKSTLARLLVGLYTPSEGRIVLDNLDLARMDVRALRRQVGIVTQQAQLFGGTVRSNIALTKPGASIERIQQAARLANVHDEIVAMPMGYETALVDRGASLSGGQQQRLALARALLNDPRLLILDEATSQLDSVSERLIQESLAALDATRIVIAHRLSTVMRADRIVVLNQGRIVETGSHDVLSRQGGLYATLVAAQKPGERHQELAV